MRRLFLSLVVAGTILLGTTVVFRDALLSRLFPLVVSRWGVVLEVQGLHLELIPLVLEVGRAHARWRGGEGTFMGIRARLSLFSPLLKGLVVDDARVVVVRGSSGGRGGRFYLPWGLEELRVKRFALILVTPRGRGEIRDCGIVVDTRRYNIQGNVAWDARAGALRGAFCLSGKRETLGEGRPRGGGWFRGTFSLGGRVVEGRLSLPLLELDPRGPLVVLKGGLLEIPGVLRARGDFSMEKGKWTLGIKGRLISLRALREIVPSLPPGLEGSLEFQGKLSQAESLNYTLGIKGGKVMVRDLGKVRRASVSFSGTIQGKGDGGNLTLSRVEIGDLELPWGRDGGWKGRGWGSWRDWGKGGLSFGLSLARGGMDLTLKGSSPGGWREGGRITLGFRGITGAWLASWRIPGVAPLVRGNLKGKLQGRMVARFTGSKWGFQGRLLARGLSVSWPSGNGVEGVRLALALGSRDLFRGPWQVSLDLIKGQALYSYWFLDFARFPWHLALRVSRTGEAFCVEEARYKGLGQLGFEGRFCFPGGGGGKVVFKGESGRLYRLLVAEPLGEGNPFLGSLSLKGGVEAHLAISRKGKWSMKGTVDWRGELKTPGVFFEGRLDLPLVFASRGREEGSIALKELKLGPLSLRGWASSLEATPFRVTAPRGYTFSLWQGRVEWGPLLVTYRNPLSPGFEVRGLSFHGLVPPKSPLPMVLEGSFDRIEGNLDAIRFHGVIKVKVAKGEGVITNLRVLHPFSDLMKVACDIEFNHLDLDDLTRITPFGRITGFIKGYIKRLVISHGQPEAFRLLVETQDVKGVKKRISIEAINSISILGGGGPVSLFLPFFKNFGYKYLGLSCTLKNDVFTLHGLKKKGKVEYIVERGGLTGVDVINRNPDNSIGFQDMLDRLDRIRRGSHGKN